MQRFRVGYLLIVLSLLWPVPGSAAKVPINFTSITVKEGLPSNTVYNILKDKFGFMWFGTNNGLCRFDGTNFSVYRHEPGKAYTIPGNEILCSYETNAGQLWIGVGAGGICYYDRAKDRILPYLGDGSWPELAHISPRAIFEDHQGQLWVATYGDLRTINLRNGKITRIYLNTANKKPDKNFVVLSLLEDSKKQMWIGTNNGLFSYDLQSKSSKRFINDPNDSGSLSNDIVKSMVEDKNGCMWFATLSGLNQLLPSGRFAIFRYHNKQANSLSSNAIFSMKIDMNGKFWLGTEDGVNIFDPRDMSFEAMKPDPRNIFSLKSQSIRSIFIDPAGIFWIGTFGGGLAKYDKNLPLFNLQQSNAFDPSGLASPVINSFVQLSENSIYIATDRGIQVFDNRTGLFKHIEIKSRQNKSGSGLAVLSLYIDHKGSLWAGTYHEGIFRIDTRTGKYDQFIADRKPGALNNNDITTIMEDKYGKMWIGTSGGGVNIFNPLTHHFTSFSQEFHQTLPINNFITCIVKSNQGDIWIASAGTGVVAFDPSKHTLSTYNKAHNNLPDDVIEHLFFDKDGILWVSTEGGISGLDIKTQLIKTYTEKDGLANGMVKSILEDKSGLLWVSTDHGISSFNKNTERFRNFDAENGVQQGAFSTGAGIRLSNGDIYFGGRDGFNYFSPSSLPAQTSSGTVLLTELKINNDLIAPQENGPIKEQISVSKEIDLKYGLNFSIGFTALNYTSPLQNQFAYRLVGFDKDWNYVHKSKNANYTNIDPGTYTFQVKVSNDGVHWNSRPKEIKITVFPPLWRTKAAYASYILLVGMFLLLLRRRGIHKIRAEYENQQEKLQIKQAMDQERREAEQLHELDLLKIKFLTDLSHEFRTPISLILAPIEKLLQRKLAVEEMDDIRMVNRNARRLLNMVNQLLDFRKMEEQELSLNLEPGDIISFIVDTGESFKDVAAKKQIIFTIKSTCPCWWTSFDHNKLERIIFNLLSNAFKFTPYGGEVSLHIDMNEVSESCPHLIIRVMDTGIGIPQQELTKIFDRFYQHQTSTILNQGTGIGLSIIKEFVQMHGGSIRAESVAEKGSCFVVDLPMEAIKEVITDENLVPLTIASIYEMPGNIPEEAWKDNSLEMTTVAKNTTILLVEDNDEFRSYLAEHLRRYYHIIEATNGKEGWQKTLSAHPQLVVSDINMPVMNGIDLSRKIKEDKRTCHIPVILLTAMTGEEEQLKGLKSGASDYLSKPFNFQILNTKIGNLLDLNKSVKDTYSKQIQLSGQDIVTESGNLKLLNSILKHIEEKLSDPDLSVEELSKHVGMSRGSLYYKLIELTGLSPIEYIRNIRLEKAEALMESSELNVAQIAYMTGFGTPSYFTRMFKGKYGVVPSEYLNAKRASAKAINNPLV